MTARKNSKVAKTAQCILKPTTTLKEAPKPMLQQAHDLILGARQGDYGDKLQNFSQIAMLFQGALATKLAPGQSITAEDVALLMMQVKIARLAKNPDHSDSILDVAGYAGCYSILQEERLKHKPLEGATYDPRWNYGASQP